jgi:hypothetical protein
LLVTFSVNVTMPPASTGLGVAVAESARSAASAMATVVLPEAVQEPLVTTTLMTAVPLGPAVQRIDGVPLPLVMVPPVIVQSYVEPLWAAGTEAVLDVELEATEAGAETVVLDAPLPTETVCDAEPVHPAALVTLTL